MKKTIIKRSASSKHFKFTEEQTSQCLSDIQVNHWLVFELLGTAKCCCHPIQPKPPTCLPWIEDEVTVGFTHTGQSANKMKALTRPRLANNIIRSCHILWTNLFRIVWGIIKTRWWETVSQQSRHGNKWSQTYEFQLSAGLWPFCVSWPSICPSCWACPATWPLAVSKPLEGRPEPWGREKNQKENIRISKTIS